MILFAAGVLFMGALGSAMRLGATVRDVTNHDVLPAIVHGFMAFLSVTAGAMLLMHGGGH